ncbi:MAG: T9SS type A sorting domain-containing protein [Bacteroidia bacterium]|jgi:hypothetical protein|nr:T9SS type A sorting domain-containing protein [Bacteroidia bacterium]
MKKLVFSILFLFSLSASAQTLTGVINSYLRVTAISGNTLTCDNLSGPIGAYSAGSFAILIQMKGATITTTNNFAYGNLISLNNAGNFNIVQISSVSGTGPYTVTLSAPPANPYNAGTPGGYVQLISYPIYNNATVTGTLMPGVWSRTTGTGGVLAFQVINTLTVSGNISADGMGFAGGTANTITNGGANDSVNYVLAAASGAGMKGEGITDFTTGLEYGRGAQATGGGGANPHNAGGGGGANAYDGGQGGTGWAGAGGPLSNMHGRGGKGYTYNISNLRFMMGGGGGSGQQNNGFLANGGAGGGIVVIKAGTVVTANCPATYSITSRGVEGQSANGNDGAGGGGAGGVIHLDVTSWAMSCPLNISTSGGNGGNVGSGTAHGGGGGGSTGMVILTAPPNNSNLHINSQPGIAGLDCTCSIRSGTSAQSPVNTVLIGGTTPLPVEWLSHEAQCSPAGVQLKWTTASEQNNAAFRIEKMNDAGSVEIVAQVAAAGNSTQPLTYTHTDIHTQPGIWYYRIRQIDFNGASTVTAWMSISCETNRAPRLQVFSCTGNCTGALVQFSGFAAQQASMQITDMQGRTVWQNTTEISAQTFTFDLTQTGVLANGIYIITVQTQEGVFAERFLVQQ